MGHTNSTANLSLPQFIGTDKPTWLGDVNGAMSAIDAYAGTNDAAVAAVDAKADGAVSDASAAVATATAANNTAGAASTAATQANSIANNALTVANNADGHTNQLETKVGLLADLHTTDKTSIVNAINEVKDAEGNLADLTTTDKSSLVAAINEAAQGGGSSANIRYNDVAHTIEVYDNGSWQTVFVNIYPGTYKGTLIFMLSMNTTDYSCKVLSVSLSIDGSSNYVYVALDNEETFNNINSNTSTQVQDHGLLGFGGYYGAGYGVHVLGAAGIKTKTFTANNIGSSTNTAIINAMLPIASADLSTPATPSDMNVAGSSSFTNSAFMFILAS